MGISQGGDKGADNYAAMHAGFRWQVPREFNIAQVCCTRWAEGADGAGRIAIHEDGTEVEATSHTYAQLHEQAARLSNVLAGLGVTRGDRVAIVMPQRFETAVAYMAVFQMGAVAMPLSMLFGPEALAYRLQDSDAVVAICDEGSIDSLKAVRGECPALRQLLGVGGASAQADLEYDMQVALQVPRFTPVATLADEGAVLIYTSGTTGPPKGALIPHRALIGNLTGFTCSQNWFGFSTTLAHGTPSSGSGEGRDGGGRVWGNVQSAGPKETRSVFWSPADWAWTGGLMDALLPTLYFGREIVAFNGRFSPEMAFSLMQKYKVTHSFLFPTALKAMMKAYPRPKKLFRLKLKAIMSAGEAVGDAVFAYCRDELGVTVNEMFGQTEINYVVGNCAMEFAPTLAARAAALPPEGAQSALGRPGGGLTAHRDVVGWPARPGSMGRGYPGHRVAVIDDDGNECPVGVAGDVAVNRFDVHGDPDPIFFLGYWKNEEATRRKYTGDWCRTGDLATRDADGYLWYQGRADDMFKAAGYRIGPGEIENCLVKHAAVANAAVVPKPDKARGAVVKAFVVLSAHAAASRSKAADAQAFDAELIAELQDHIKGKLAPYEYPKEIEFIEALPMTTTGKVQRRVLRLQEEEKARASG